MRWKLTAAVGKGQPNHRDDVKKVQILLNRAAHEDHSAILHEDGLFGPKTQARIEEFQRNQVHLSHADGVVNRNGPTYGTLNSGGRPAQPHTASAPRPAAPAAAAHVVEPDSGLAKLLQQQAAQRPANRKVAWFNRALPAAINVKARWGVPIAVTLAQGALESSWGTHAPGNIFFGVKGKSPDGKSINVTTHENYGGKSTVIQDGFRSYDTLEQSADDYGRFLASNQRYAGAFAYRNDPEKFIHVVAKAGYATDPHYEKKILSIIRVNGLKDYDAPDVATSATFQNALHQ
ncbi:MAG TPA: flagellar biosynthesis protein FlgJ [Erwinia sp.]|uniref:glucosaminidase domain-containing protein n=1 Tax=Erwinia citreus TaxID=558 RepID=UPI000E98A94E|nr:glucosaminidase domain-containing protein [Erwinia sp.]HBV38871.1 flagellar biosynthesis protein FlgJ [Erwinia sp.]